MNILSQFRIVSLIEGISYLILLGFAMPMKYIFDNEIFVKFFGMAHGVLFVLFIVLLGICFFYYKFSILKSIKIFIYSLIPFGFILIDRLVKKA
ncbi:MAG: Unknown protein [uncultured Campylobacterales bacterium]|uniref:DUF3817 domain-containing protein n=1 Tax=uncultured Campylobacterales bacterium TaxID=352960 RepID=A0A6S6SKK1_9BACT|nr:MAG: Unknown protein [uncultured Campylobacterales bacterium]